MQYFIGLRFSLIALFITSISLPNLHSQILGTPKEKIWNFIGSYQQSGSGNGDYIGNYECLDLSNTTLQNNLKKIGENRSGTLFIVGKLPSGFNNTPFLELGGLAITSDSVFCAKHPIPTEPLTEEAFIFKVKYQAGFKRLWDKNHFYILPSVKIAEVVFYEEQLTQVQSRIVESYLALKYSINITQNTEKVLRDYWANDSTKLWTTQADGTYDEEVMALGRLDFMQWEQGQTFTSDAQSIGISLEDPITLGNSPNKKVKDGSVVVISKRLWTLKGINCGSANTMLPWKFRFFNWDTNADWLYLKWDSILNLQSAPKFSNGISEVPLTFLEQNGVTEIIIPLSHLDSVAHQNWYLVWDNSHLACLPLGNLSLNPCGGNGTGVGNSLRLNLEDKALPSQYHLQNSESGEFISGDITQGQTLMESIPEGQYHLRVYNNEGEWVDEVLQFAQCQGATNASLKSVSVSQSTVALTANVDVDKGRKEGEAQNLNLIKQTIDVFPNPLDKGSSFTAVFSSDLYEQEFHIRMVDQAGKILYEDRFVPMKGLKYQKAIAIPGVYLLHFKGETYSEIKQIIVK